MEEGEIDSETDQHHPSWKYQHKIEHDMRSEKCRIREDGTRTTICSRGTKRLKSEAGSARDGVTKC